MINRIDFESWVKYICGNLYDFAALETHPLTEMLVRLPAGQSKGRGEKIRMLFNEALESLRPPGREYSPNQPEWRPYFILRQRYVEGIPLPQLSVTLAISDRQLRRDHHRAVEALTLRLWDLLQPEEQPEGEGAPKGQDTFQFEAHVQPVNLLDVLGGVQGLLQRRVEDLGSRLEVHSPPELPPVFADRIILRQILISLVNHALRSHSSGPLSAHVEVTPAEVLLRLSYCGAGSPNAGQEMLLDTAGSWARQFPARFESSSHPLEGGQRVELSIWLRRADQRLVLVVDDQEPAISLFRRYLARTDLQVVGITQASQALSTAGYLQPVLIMLDVMMPQTDGWELLQSLKMGDDTHDIPVLVCSAWEEPELALSLGAAGFLKKPVTQKVLLDALQGLGILDQSTR